MIIKYKISGRARGNVIRCLHQLKLIFKDKNHLSADAKKIVSDTTQKNRWNCIQSIFVDLAELDFYIPAPQNLKMKHIVAITQLWVNKDLSPKTFCNYFSYLKTFCVWIGKPELIIQMDKSHIPADKLECPSKATEDKDWSKSDKFLEVMVKVACMDLIVATALMLMHEFGLRRSEALCSRLWVADCGTVLQVSWGAKNGRSRSIPIETQSQRDILVFAKSLIPASRKSYSLIPRDKTLKQAKNRFNYVVRECGVTGKNGMVSHGLRHGFAHRQFEKECGLPAPIVSGQPCPKTQEVRIAKIKTSEEMGHSRESVCDSYNG